MTIAIVIGTHGWAAEQLLKTAEMLLGEQENVGWIDFVPGENAETLIEKYNAQLAKLDTTKGVLGRQPVQCCQPHCRRQRAL